MVQLTPVAVTKVKEILTQQNPSPTGLRVAVVGGGCSGFSYHMAFENAVNENFQAVEFIDVVAILIDLVLESHVIAETRATAAHYRDAQAGGRGSLLRQDFLHFGDGYWR